MKYKAKVINRFQEKNHENHTYEPGDVYPAEGYQATKKRIEFLSEKHPEYKKAFVSDIEEVEGTKKGETKADKE